MKKLIFSAVALMVFTATSFSSEAGKAKTSPE
jgi:hypothetical protein